MSRAKLPKNAKELAELSVSKRVRAAEEIGAIVGKTIEKAAKQANKFLKKYGYSVTVTLNFHQLEDVETASKQD